MPTSASRTVWASSSAAAAPPEYTRDEPDLIRIARHFFAENKPIASVCHGVEIPARAGCVRGRRMATMGKCRRTWHDHGHYMGYWMLIAARAARHGLPEAAA